MLEGTGTFAVWALNRFHAYDRPNIIANGVAKFTHHTVGFFYAIGFCFLTL